jgi:hypothetical protein
MTVSKHSNQPPQKPTDTPELALAPADEWDDSEAFSGNDSGSAASSGSSPDAPEGAVLSSFAAMYLRREETKPNTTRRCSRSRQHHTMEHFIPHTFLVLLAHGSAAAGSTLLEYGCPAQGDKARQDEIGFSYMTESDSMHKTLDAWSVLSHSFPSRRPSGRLLTEAHRRGCRQRKDKLDGISGGHHCTLDCRNTPNFGPSGRAAWPPGIAIASLSHLKLPPLRPHVSPLLPFE